MGWFEGGSVLPRAALLGVGLLAFGSSGGHGADYVPPAASAALLGAVDFRNAVPIDEDYRAQFASCDRNNVFRGFGLTGHYRCASDPSNVKALLRLPNGGVYWESKMALDVDGAWAAWNGLAGATDQKFTSYRWPNVANANSRAAQIDPDRFPFIVIPSDGIRSITGAAAPGLGAEFATRTRLSMPDMGVVIYKNRWTPAFIADGGPFMRLGEGSSAVFEHLGISRCIQWSADRTHCVGPGNNRYPYRDFGVDRGVIFIVFPGSGRRDMTAANALAVLCEHARMKLGLTGSSACP
jgi:hypothetical protein